MTILNQYILLFSSFSLAQRILLIENRSGEDDIITDESYPRLGVNHALRCSTQHVFGTGMTRHQTIYETLGTKLSRKFTKIYMFLETDLWIKSCSILNF